MYQIDIIIQKVLKKSNPKSVITDLFNNNREIKVDIIGKAINTTSVCNKGMLFFDILFCICKYFIVTGAKLICENLKKVTKW